MWSYFREKYCTVTGCIEANYAYTLAEDEQIKAALVQIKNAEAAIESRVAELIAQNPEPDA
jgi:hypothetical protein